MRGGFKLIYSLLHMRQTRLVCTWCLLTLGACTSVPPPNSPTAYTLVPGRAWAMHVSTPATVGVTHLQLRLLGRTTEGELQLNVVAAQAAARSAPSGSKALLIPGPTQLLPQPWHFTRQQLTQLEAAGGELDLTLPTGFEWPRSGIFLVLESLPTHPAQRVLGLVSSPQLGGPARQYVIIGPDSIQLIAARQVSADSFPHLLSYLNQSASHPQLIYRRHTNEPNWQLMTGPELRFGLDVHNSPR